MSGTEESWQELRHAARVAKHAGDLAGAARLFRAAIAACPANADAEPLATLYNSLADACRRSRDLPGALAAAQAGLAQRRAGGSALLVGNDCMMLALVRADMGMRAEAAAAAEEAFGLYVAAYGAEHTEVRAVGAFLAAMQRE